MKRRAVLFLSVGFAVLVAIIICGINVLSINVSLPSLVGKPDGTYRGEYSLIPTPTAAIVDVTVQSEKLVKIDIIQHKASEIGKKAEIIIPQIIEKQSLDIDAVSGATASSKTLLKAVENALR